MTVTDEDKALLTLLRAKSTYQTSGGTMAEWINPDGPLAADRIEALTAEVERLRAALEIAQDYKDCGCSYDNPNDICLGHLKLFERLNARAALGPKP